MIYLQRRMAVINGGLIIDIAAVEDERSAAGYETQGFERCSYTAFREAWSLRDQNSLERLRGEHKHVVQRHGIYAATS